MPSAKGSCVCGAYTYEYTGDVFDVTICHCRPCQKWYNYGSVNLFVDRDQYKKLSGGEVTATRKGDSGKDVTNHSCEKCYAVMWTDVEAVPDKLIIKAGTLDDPDVRNRLHPTAEIYCRNKSKLISLLDDVKHVDGAPH